MSEVRIAARTLGPGEPGFLRVLVALGGVGGTGDAIDVPIERIPVEWHTPNATFVVVLQGREVVRTEPEGAQGLEIRARIREVLEHDWDPIGVFSLEGSGADVAGEYDDYIAEVHALLVAGASDRQVARHLREIERKKMGLRGTPTNQRLDVAKRLRGLGVPRAE